MFIVADLVSLNVIKIKEMSTVNSNLRQSVTSLKIVKILSQILSVLCTSTIETWYL